VKCKDWPFRPQHITDVTADFDGDIAPLLVDPALRELARLTGPGILSHSHLQGFQSAISHAVGRPTTIIEFAPDGEVVRTDSPFLERLMTPAYRKLREGCNCCEPTDNIHAKLFRDHDAFQSLDQLMANVAEAKVKEQSNGLPYGSNLVVGEHDGRVFLSYDCPNIGYREYTFPIIFGGRLLGVFFAGQIILDTRQDEILTQIRSLPERLPSGLLLTSSSAVALAKDVEKAHIDWIKDPKNLTKSSELDGLVPKVCFQLSMLEKQLANNLELQRKAYVTSHVREIMSAFRAGLPRDVVDSRATLDGLWKCASVAFESIVRAFALRYIVLFGVEQAAVTNVQTLHVVAKAGDYPVQFAPNAAETTLNLKVVENAINAQSGALSGEFVYASENENSECLAALENCDLQQCGDFELVLLPVPLHPQSSIGLLFGYTKAHPRSAPENSRESDLHNALEAFWWLLASSVSAALASIAQKITYDQLKILGHESSQLISGIDLIRDTYLKNYSTIERLTPEKVNDICRNLDAFLQNLSHLLGNEKSLLLDTLPYRPEEFLVEKELLFKWKEFYRAETRRRDLQIRIAEFPRYASPAYPPVWGDKALFEQLLYNLLNNAIKYAHQGTKIHVDCRPASGESNAPHRLSITDYGAKMPINSRVYELYYRESNVAEGLGVGLFLCKRIADAHGGKIWHTCDQQPVSRLNVPLIEPFLRAYEEMRCSWGTKQLYAEVLEERDRIADRLESVVATGFRSGEPIFRPSSERFTREELYQPTYEVTAWVELPRRARERKI